MSSRDASRLRPRKASRKAQWRLVLLKVWPSVRSRRRALRAFRKAPCYWQFIIAVAIVLAAWLILNWVYQVLHKPSELLFPVSGTLYKTPPQTWHQYGPLFEKYATRIMTPELLAAIAQVEGSGNPIVRTYWRWSWRPWPFDLYRPASSAVGMYQITDGTFAEARRYCIHEHQVIDAGPWDAWQSCWFNSLYTRVVPGHAVELTSAYLHHHVASILARRGIRAATLAQKQDLAAVIHLCGPAAGDAYARRGLHLLDGQRCGDHEVHGYVERVAAMKRVFAMLRAGHERI